MVSKLSFVKYYRFFSVQKEYFALSINIGFLCLFCFRMVNMVMCRKQKFQVKRCCSLKKVENQWAKETIWVQEESNKNLFVSFGF